MVKLPQATLLLSPNGNHDRTGPVSPTNFGGVSVVDGVYGPAWAIPATSYPRLNTTIDTVRGSCLMRFWANARWTTNHYVIGLGMLGAAGQDFIGVTLNRTTGATIYATVGTSPQYSSPNIAFPAGLAPTDLHTLYLAWDGPTVHASFLGGGEASLTRDEPIGTGNVIHIGNRALYGLDGGVEGAVFFDRPLTVAEREAIGNLPRRWTWGELGRANTHLSRPRATGSFAFTAELWRADRYGNLIERVEDRYPVQGSIAFNQNTSTKRTLSLTVNEPQVFRAYRDFLVPILTLTDPTGQSRSRRMGHYVALQPRGTITPARRSGTIKAKGIEHLLELDTLDGGLAVPAGTDPGAAARDIALGGGFLPSQLNLPDIGEVLVSEMYFDPGTTRLAAINDLYNAGAWYTVWSTGEGILMSMPYQNLQEVAATVRYSTHEGMIRLLGAIEDDPDITRIRNRVTVRNIAPESEPIYATAEITNPAHPLHRDHIGIVIAETVDDPDMTSPQAALQRAQGLLSEGASYYRKLTIKTVLDLDAEAHQVIELDVPDDLEELTGRWWRQAWSVELRGAQAITTHEINRVEVWQ